MYESKYKELIKYLTNDLDMVLLDSEIQDIETLIYKDIKAIAVNGCCKSDSEQLLSLEDNKEDEYWNDYLNNQMSADQ